MSRPTMCPVCGCPIQLLADHSEPTGTILDALNAHAKVVHPSRTFCWDDDQ